MTIADTIATIKALPGMTARYRDGEFRVTFTVDAMMNREGLSRTDAIARCEAVAAYDSDAESAIGNARAMATPTAPDRHAVQTDESGRTFIDMTPTWEEIVPTLLRIWTDGDAKGRAYALGEFQRLGAIADMVKAQGEVRDACRDADTQAGRDTFARGGRSTFCPYDRGSGRAAHWLAGFAAAADEARAETIS